MADQNETGGETRGTDSMQERVRTAQIEARARNISHNVRCLECGHQAIEESQADIAIRLRQVIRDELRKGKTDKEIYTKLTTEYGETILYSPQFDAQSAVLWLLPVVTVGMIAGVTLYRGRRQPVDVGALTQELFHGIPLSPIERQTLTAIVEPPHRPAQNSASGLKWFRGLFGNS